MKLPNKNEKKIGLTTPQLSNQPILKGFSSLKKDL